MTTCPHCGSENFEAAETCFRCGHSLALVPGATVASRYEIKGLLGKGGMGVVYQAHDRILDETVALKVLLGNFAKAPELARRFRSEIKLARKVSHRNVCRIHEYGEDGGIRYISMEFIEGINLKQLVRSEGGLPPEQAHDVAVQIAKGLEAIHEAGIIHRDLKTANIMRSTQGLVKLMDFGIAKQGGDAATTGLTAKGEIMGTPEYMSPEQARGQKIDFRSDIYALGIVIFETLTGAPPFKGPTPLDTFFMHVQDQPPLERVPPSFVPVLRKALAKNPDERYATARGMVAALRQAGGAESQTGPLAAIRREEAQAPAPPAGAAAGPASLVLGPVVPAGPAAVPPPPFPMFEPLDPTDPTMHEKVQAFVQALKDRDVGVRWRSALALYEVGPAARSAIPALIQAVEDPAPPVAEAASEALKKITGKPLGDLVAPVTPSPPRSAPPVANLASALGGEDMSARWRAAVALGEIGPAARDAVTALIDALDDGDEGVRWAAAAALGKIGPAARDAVPALTAALSDKDDDVMRRHAAVAVGKIGPAAHNAVAALIAAFKDKDTTICDAAGEALVQIGPAGVPGLIEALKDDDERVRWKAADTLTKIGTARGEAKG